MTKVDMIFEIWIFKRGERLSTLISPLKIHRLVQSLNFKIKENANENIFDHINEDGQKGLNS